MVVAVATVVAVTIVVRLWSLLLGAVAAASKTVWGTVPLLCWSFAVLLCSPASTMHSVRGRVFLLLAHAGLPDGSRGSRATLSPQRGPATSTGFDK